MEENYNPSQRLGKGFVVEFIQRGEDGKLIYDKSFTHIQWESTGRRHTMDNKDYRLAVLGKMLEMAENISFEDEIGFLYDHFIPLAKGVANIDLPPIVCASRLIELRLRVFREEKFPEMIFDKRALATYGNKLLIPFKVFSTELRSVDFEELMKEFRNDLSDLIGLIEPMFGLNMTYDAKEWEFTIEITKNDDDFRTE